MIQEQAQAAAAEFAQLRTAYNFLPGMAGWGLVRQGYAATKGDQLVKLQYDLYYIKHQSTWLDIVVLTRSVLRAMAFRGR